MTVADERPVEADDESESRVAVTAHSCSPERTVFTEKGNTDAWIATDTTVELDD
jgi:hypothetical protein